MRVSFQKLKYFVVAAEHGNVTSAATSLNVSQPSISVAISQLESDLETQLFYRHHAKGISLTPAGRVAYQQAKDILAKLDGFASLVQESNAKIKGTLQVACLNYLAPRYFGEIISGFKELHPDIFVQFSDTLQEDLLKGIKLGEFELGVTYDLVPDESFLATPLAESKPYLILPSNHRLADQISVSLSDLRDDPCVLFDLPISKKYYRVLFDTVGITPNISYKTTTIEATRGFVANGLGYSILTHPIPSHEAYDGKRVVRVEISDKIPAVRIACVQNAELALRPLAEIFKNYLLEKFSSFNAGT